MLEHLFIVSLENGLLVYDIPYASKEIHATTATATTTTLTTSRIEPMHYSSILFSMFKLIQSISSEKEEQYFNFVQERRQIEIFPFSQGSLSYIFVLFFNSPERQESQRRLLKAIHNRIGEFPPLITVDGKVKKSFKSLLQNIYLQFYLSEKDRFQQTFLPSCEFYYSFSVTMEAEKRQLSINTDALITAKAPAETVFSPNLQKSEIRPQVLADHFDSQESSNGGSFFLACCCSRNKVENYHPIPPATAIEEQQTPQQQQQQIHKADLSSNPVKDQVASSAKPKRVLYPFPPASTHSPASSSSSSTILPFHQQILPFLSLLQSTSPTNSTDDLIYFEVSTKESSKYFLVPLPPVNRKQLEVTKNGEEEVTQTANLKPNHSQPLILQSIEDDDPTSPKKGKRPNELPDSPQKGLHQSTNTVDQEWMERQHNSKIFLFENTGLIIRSGILPHSTIPWNEMKEFLQWTKFCFEEKVLSDVQFF